MACDERHTVGIMCLFVSLLPLSLYVLSVCMHAWLLVEVDPSRTECTAIGYESIVALSVNVLLLFAGAAHGYVRRRGDFKECMDAFMPLGSSALAAVVVVLSGRLTLFVYEAPNICAAELGKVEAGDLLVDSERRDRAGAAAWLALVLLGLALLLQHAGAKCDDVDDGKKYDDDDDMYEEESGRRRRRTRRNFDAW